MPLSELTAALLLCGGLTAVSCGIKRRMRRVLRRQTGKPNPGGRA